MSAVEPSLLDLYESRLSVKLVLGASGQQLTPRLMWNVPLVNRSHVSSKTCWNWVHAMLHRQQGPGMITAAGLQVVACEIEEFMRDFSQPWFERAGVADKVTLPVLPSPAPISTVFSCFCIAIILSQAQHTAWECL